jgi:2-polyprenyl-3-methyl-5-hydroxy-6-metoxy-1,4-benzoquinol methylase
MAGSTDVDALPSESSQKRFWNEWNAKHRGNGYDVKVDRATLRRRDTAVRWLGDLPIIRPRILDLGCATGWLTSQLADFGEVVGTDIADASISEARRRYPGIRFECEDFGNSRSHTEDFDVVVSLETLSHVPDQTAFIERIRDALKPGGYLILTTQNRIVFERRADVTARAEGQIRNWVSPGQLRTLLKPHFRILTLTTALPEGHLGFLRLVNSARLNRIAGSFLATTKIERAKENLGLGQTIAVLAQRY